MSEKETPEEALTKHQQQMLEDFQQMVENVLAGRSSGLIMMTFGEGGKTMLSGDPGQLLLALETAKTNLISYTMQQAARAQREQASNLFNFPTAGSA